MRSDQVMIMDPLVVFQNLCLVAENKVHVVVCPITCLIRPPWANRWGWPTMAEQEWSWWLDIITRQLAFYDSVISFTYQIALYNIFRYLWFVWNIFSTEWVMLEKLIVLSMMWSTHKFSSRVIIITEKVVLIPQKTLLFFHFAPERCCPITPK